MNYLGALTLYMLNYDEEKLKFYSYFLSFLNTAKAHELIQYKEAILPV